MKITALGHSCVLLEFQHPHTGEITRILIDPWLSDHAIGDAMGRFPRLRFDIDVLSPIDAVYLTHAHCDHLDPYTLLRLWSELESPPALLLPASLSAILPIFREHLKNLDVHVLHAHTPVSFRGVELLGFYDVSLAPNNEEDVMILVVTSGAERVLVEADARLSLELPDFRAFVSALLNAPGVDSAVYLTTENELTGTMETRTCTTTTERLDLAEFAMDEMLEAVVQLYEPVDDPNDLWMGEHILRLIHGQGLCAPHELDLRWHRILFPVQIKDRVQAERAIAKHNGFRHHIDALTVGAVHTVVNGRLSCVEPLAGLALLDRDTQRVFDPKLAFFPVLPIAPIRSDARSPATQRTRILALLNERFLPYLHGLRNPPVLHLLSGYGGSYTIRIHFGDATYSHTSDFVLSWKDRNFRETSASEQAPQEAYWANDLEDFLDGRCDEYTPFCRTQFEVEEMRLWVCLATPLLNSDLVAKRVQLHFERAQQGLSPGSFILPFYEDVIASP